MLAKYVVKQNDSSDCGSACLSSIIKYYQGFIPLEKIRLDTKTTRKGVTAYNLVETAKRYGFDAYGVKLTDFNLDDIVLPVIAHLSLSNGLFHYVVIYKLKKNDIWLMDPESGIKKISREEFMKKWTKIIIVLYPVNKIPKYPPVPKISEIFKTALKDEKKLFFNLILTSILETILIIITSFSFKSLMQVASSHDKHYLYLIIGLFLILYLIKNITNYLKNNLENYLNKNLDIKIILPFVLHIFRLPLIAITNRSTGEIITRISEMNNIKDFFSQIIITVFLDLVFMLSAAVVLVNINKELFDYLLLFSGCYLGLGFLFTKIDYEFINENIVAETNLNASLVEKIGAFESLKNINQGEYLNKDIEYKIVSYLRKGFIYNCFKNKMRLSKNLLDELGNFIIISLAFILILNNQLTLIDLITFTSLMGYFKDPIKQMIELLPKYNYLKITFNKISEFIYLEEEKLDLIEKFFNGPIKIENISYTYNNFDYPLKNFNLEINQGEKVYLKGRSGRGKSTLCKLLVRLYDDYQGQITINNINIKDYSLNTLRSNIAYVSQSEKIFSDTIKNNICLDKKCNIKIMEKVMDICGLDDVIKSKPLRLETKLDEGGFSLSGGEKQRLILARTLYQNKPIIILDEAISAVDEEGEISILNQINNNFPNLTLIFITHHDLPIRFDRQVIME